MSTTTLTIRSELEERLTPHSDEFYGAIDGLTVDAWAPAAGWMDGTEPDAVWAMSVTERAGDAAKAAAFAIIEAALRNVPADVLAAGTDQLRQDAEGSMSWTSTATVKLTHSED